VDLENMEAWEVFQRYSSPMGADSGTILALCRACRVRDPLETLEKVLNLIGEIEKENG